MKVSYVTLFEIHWVKKHISALAVSLAVTLASASCSLPALSTTARVDPPDQIVTPPIESVWLRLPPSAHDVPAAIRRAMYAVGLQASADRRDEQWIGAHLGGVWEDAYRYRQWQIVASYAPDSSADGTLVVLRALEHQTSYLTPLGVRGREGGDPSSGFTRTRRVSNLMRGDSHEAWVHVEKVAFALTDRGGELLTDLSGRDGMRP